MDGANRSAPVGILLEEYARCGVPPGPALFPVSECPGNLPAVLGSNVDQKDCAIDSAPAVILPVVQLAFRPDVAAEANTAFPAPVTDKFRHSP